MHFVEQVERSNKRTAVALASSAAEEAAAASGAEDSKPAARATIAVQRTRTSEVRQRPIAAVLVSYTFKQAGTVQVFFRRFATMLVLSDQYSAEWQTQRRCITKVF